MYISNIMQCPIRDVGSVRFPLLNEWSYPNQKNPFWRFYWNTPNAGRIEHRGKVISLKPDKVYLVAANTDYRTWCEKPFLHFYIHFDLNFGCAPGVYEFPLDEATRADIEHLRATGLPDRAVLSNPTTVGIIFEMLLRTVKKLPPEKIAQGTIDSRIHAVLNYIDNHLGEVLSNTQLARIAGMHPNAFIRTFKQICHYSPQSYVTRRRCMQASRELEDNLLTIDAIAEKLGFCDRYHFTKVYTRLTQISPAVYRTRYRAAQSDLARMTSQNG